MDLDNFDNELEGLPDFHDEDNAGVQLTAKTALEHINDGWYAKTTRSGRWMDLIGDYAGAETFVIDGESLLQNVLNDPLLSLGQDEKPGFQLAHAQWSLETALKRFLDRGAVFDVVFLRTHRHSTVATGASDFQNTSRSLARRLLFRHLAAISTTLDFGVYAFEGFDDAGFNDYLKLNRPMFVMTNTQGRHRKGSGALSAEALLLQRVFFHDLLSHGVPVAELEHCEFRDSKILTFIFEQKRLVDPRSTFGEAIWSAVDSARSDLDRAEAEAGRSSSVVLDAHSSDGQSERHPLTELVSLYMEESSDDGNVQSQLLLVFVAHQLALDHLNLVDRSQGLRYPEKKKKTAKIEDSLTRIFGLLEHILLSGPLDLTLDIDGHVYMALLHTLSTVTASTSHEGLLGPELLDRITAILPQSTPLHLDLKVLISAFGGEVKWHLPSPSPTTHMRAPLLPFSHPVFDAQLASIDITTRRDDAPDSPISPTSPTENPNERGSHMDFNTPFADTQHWHAHKKSILPKHLGGDAAKLDARAEARARRSEQLQMKQLRNLAETLTGALGTVLQQVAIAPTGVDVLAAPPKTKMRAQERPRAEKPVVQGAKGKGKEKPVKKSKADQLRDNIAKEKMSKEGNESAVWWQGQLAALDKLTSLEAKVSALDGLLRSKRSQGNTWLASEMRLYAIHLELLAWIEHPERAAPQTHDGFAVSVLRRVRALYRHKALTPTVAKKLAAVLTALGLEAYIPAEEASSTAGSALVEDRALSFDCVKLVKSKTGGLYHKFMRISEPVVRWQLRVFGEFMDRSMDGAPDARVAFEPDGWQRDVLDCLDADSSILVSAPTSAGKTFISYYAMEQVLRQSDNGIIVYVAPTKALVMQIAAEVYARFKKDLNGPSVWSVHTRDFRINDPQNCQILVTVPEMLAIMLLSPPLARVWTPRIKRVVLDEIHSIGQQEGGAVWEQIILLAPCPIIGLSATIGQPHVFSEWLESVQRAHGHDYKFIDWPTRYSHLRKHIYLHQIEATQPFGGLHEWKDSGRLRFTHPLSLLPFGQTSLPLDLALEARDTLSVYDAMVKESLLSDEKREALNPEVYFSTPTFLRQKDVLAYEAQLMGVLSGLLTDSRSLETDSPLQRLVHTLEDPRIAELSDAQLITEPEPAVFLDNLLPMLLDLNSSGDLPALLFSFDRNHCEIIAKHINDQLVKGEKKWRAIDPQWKRKEQQWKDFLALRERQSKTKPARASKPKKKRGDSDDDDDGEPMGATDGLAERWEASFDPADPSPEFSFAGQKTTYSSQQLAEDIAGMAWTSTPEWAKACLRRGIGVHHAGMNKRYRSLVESLFRLGFLRVVIATGSLALGINAPTRTSVFCGDSPFLTALMYRQCAGRAGRRGFDLLGKVVFYGFSFHRARRLVYSKLPSLGGNFPLSSTMCLRLFNLIEGSGHTPVAVHAIQSLMQLPRVSFSTATGTQQLLHHLRFSIEYLRRSKLLSEDGLPLNLFGVAAHLYYTEPSNFALVALIRNGVLHELCRGSETVAKERVMLLFCHLFGRRYLPPSMASSDFIRLVTHRYPSRVVLPPLPEKARKVLVAHGEELVEIFTNYALTYASTHRDAMGDSASLPLSRKPFPPSSTDEDAAPSLFGSALAETRIETVARSPFVATSGHSDAFSSISELARSAREGLHLNEHAVPSMDAIIASGLPLNAYLYDFWTHGQVSTLVAANGIRRGDIWYLLQEFALTLMTIRGALETLIIKSTSGSGSGARAGSVASRTAGSIGTDEELESVAATVDDWESDVQTLVDDPLAADDAPPSLDGVFRTGGSLATASADDRRVLKVVDAILVEFNTKFKEMWA